MEITFPYFGERSTYPIDSLVHIGIDCAVSREDTSDVYELIDCLQCYLVNLHNWVKVRSSTSPPEHHLDFIAINHQAQVLIRTVQTCKDTLKLLG